MEQADIAATELDVVPSIESPGSRVVCLHDKAGASDWFENQVDTLNAFTWNVADGVELDASNKESINRWVEAASKTIDGMTEEPVHILATASAAYGAIVLVAQNPEKIKSLTLGDPEVDTSVEGYAETLKEVAAPTLVIASGPNDDTDFTGPQSIAGGIDNGVFIIIHNTEVPSHQTKSDSFNEWSKSFMEIADGLYTIQQQQGATA